DALLKAKTQLRQNQYGKTPLHALIRGSGRVIRGAKTDPVTYRPEQDMHIRVEIANLLMKARLPINITDTGGNTPLHAAAQEGSAPFAAWLLKKRANPNQPNRSGKTAFHLARDPETQKALRGR
ncbi:MAG: ankyrin repeat domain-containing protein, partial [Planctomycetales bacterium]